MEKLLNDHIAQQVQEVFENLEAPVKIFAFGRSGDQHSEVLEQLMGEVVALSDKLDLITYDFDSDQEAAERFHVTEAPALVIATQDGDEVVDYGVRILGTPSGHEFTSLIHGLISVSHREPPLDEETIAYLNGLEEPLRLQVFSTPG